MGHLSVSFTDDTYVTVFDSAKQEMMKALDGLFRVPCTQVAHNESEAVH